MGLGGGEVVGEEKWWMGLDGQEMGWVEERWAGWRRGGWVGLGGGEVDGWKRGGLGGEEMGGWGWVENRWVGEAGWRRDASM